MTPSRQCDLVPADLSRELRGPMLTQSGGATMVYIPHDLWFMFEESG